MNKPRRRGRGAVADTYTAVPQWSLDLITAPTAEPISVAEAKAWARVDLQADDVLIAGLITSMRQHFDGKDAWFGRALMTQTWDLALDCFPYEWPYVIRLPLPPLQGVSSVTYLDSNGVSTVLPTTEYFVDTKSEPGRLMPTYGKLWPSARKTINAITVRFVAGYGDKPTDVPDPIRTWLKQAVAHFYANREATQLPPSFLWSLASYKAAWPL